MVTNGNYWKYLWRERKKRQQRMERGKENEDAYSVTDMEPLLSTRKQLRVIYTWQEKELLYHSGKMFDDCSLRAYVKPDIEVTQFCSLLTGYKQY